MKGVFWRQFSLAACMFCCGLAARGAAADESIVAGQKVMVIDWEAKFTLDGEAVSDAPPCDTFTVGSVEGDLLWIDSKGAFLHRFDVVPADESIDYFARTVADDPSPDSFLERGFFWLTRDKFDGALSDFSVVIRLAPMAPAGYVYRSLAWYEKDCFDRTIADCTHAIGIDPDFAPAYVERGRAWCRLEQVGKAIEDFNTAIRLDPETAYAFCARGEAFRKNGDYQWALEDFARAMELKPDRLTPHEGSARVYIAKGNYRLALAEYDRMIRIDRESGLDARAWLRATSPEPALRDGGAALVDASEACEMTNWEDGSYLKTLSAALAELGMFDEAIKMLERGIELDPDHSPKTTTEMMAAFKARKAYRYEAEF